MDPINQDHEPQSAGEIVEIAKALTEQHGFAHTVSFTAYVGEPRLTDWAVHGGFFSGSTGQRDVAGYGSSLEDAQKDYATKRAAMMARDPHELLRRDAAKAGFDLVPREQGKTSAAEHFSA